MKTTLELNIHELAQVLNDGSLATLAESVKSMESFGLPGTNVTEKGTNPKTVTPTPAVPTQTTIAPVVQPTAVPVAAQVNVPQPVPVAVAPPVPVQQQMPQAVAQTMPTAVPTVATTYTLQQLALAGTQLVDAGRREEVLALLSSFGVNSLTELPKEQYGTYATKLREMGAKI